MESPLPKYLAVSIAVICAIALGAWWFLYGRDALPSNAIHLELPMPATTTPEQQALDAKRAAEGPLIPTDAAGGPVAFFFETTLGFQFQLPPSYTAYEYPPAGDGTTVVVGDDTGKGMLLRVLPVSGGAATLSQADIAQLAPGTAVKNPRPISAAGTTGIEFESQNEALGGVSEELWFRHDGNLYELSVHLADAPLLKTIIDTWVWR